MQLSRSDRIAAPISILGLLLLLSLCAGAQPRLEWSKRFNGLYGMEDVAYALALDKLSNVYVTGYSTEPGGSNEDYVTFKYSSSGVQQWVRYYNGPGNWTDVANDIAVSYDGYAFVTGFSYGAGSIGDYLTIKYSPSGQMLWQARYNGTGNADDEAHCIALDDDDNVYISGQCSQLNWPTESYDMVTIKYNSEGHQQWVAQYNGPGNGGDGACAIRVDSARNVYVAGSSGGDSTGSDYLVIKYDSNGHPLWVGRYNGPANWTDYAYDMVLCSDGGAVVTGSSLGVADYITYATTVKFSAEGTLLWVDQYSHPNPHSDVGHAVTVDSLGNVIVTGSTYVGPGFYNYDFFTIKYSPSGTRLWVQIYPGTYSNVYNGVDVATDCYNRIFVTGSTGGSGIANDITTLMYSPAGQLLQVSRIHSPTNTADEPSEIISDGANKIYICGWMSGGSIYTGDMITLKYSLNGLDPEIGETAEFLGGDQNTETQIPKDCLPCKAYPNPFNASTTLRFDLEQGDGYTVQVFDVCGRLIAELPNNSAESGGILSRTGMTGSYENQHAGVQEVIFNGATLPSGIYIYRVEAGRRQTAGKMVLIK